MKLILIFVSTFLLLFLTSCTLSEENEENHIHSIAFDTTEPGILYSATHFYIEKINLETGEKERFGKDDYMGFVITADGTFYSSGHSEAIGNVGIRKSTDKGRSWEILSYRGRDFHDMAVSYSDNNKVYAWSTPPEVFLTKSNDGGKTWTNEGNTLEMDVFALAADHQQSNRLYAGTLYGLFVSEDEGKTWNKFTFDTPITAVVDDPINENKITVAIPDKGILQTINGKDWISLNYPGEEAVVFLTVEPSSGDIYLVNEHNAIFSYNGKWNKILEGETE